MVVSFLGLLLCSWSSPILKPFLSQFICLNRLMFLSVVYDTSKIWLSSLPLLSLSSLPPQLLLSQCHYLVLHHQCISPHLYTPHPFLWLPFNCFCCLQWLLPLLGPDPVPLTLMAACHKLFALWPHVGSSSQSKQLLSWGALVLCSNSMS